MYLILRNRVPVRISHPLYFAEMCIRDRERAALIDFLSENDILAVFHYVPLHSAPAGLKYGRFHGEDRYTTKASERLLRLPMYYGLKAEPVSYISGKVKEFYGFN